MDKAIKAKDFIDMAIQELRADGRTICKQSARIIEDLQAEIKAKNKRIKEIDELKKYSKTLFEHNDILSKNEDGVGYYSGARDSYLYILQKLEEIDK